MTDITQNTALHRFETTIDGVTAYLSYVENGDTLVYDHTIVPSQLGGKGLGKTLAKHALEYAKSAGKKVMPTCSFVAAYIDKNPEYQDLLA